MTPPLDWSYDADVPNKTIYVSGGDLPVYKRAQELAGGNLSAAIASALRRYVEVEEGRREGFDEIIVRVGPGAGRRAGRKVRFVGVLLGMWADTTSGREVIFHVYRTRSGKFVVHTDRQPEYTTTDAEGKPAGWRSYLGLGNFNYGFAPGESTLEVVDSLDALRERIPAPLFDMVAAASDRPAIEDLDI